MESLGSTLLPAFPSVGSLAFVPGLWRKHGLRGRLASGLALAAPLLVLAGLRAVLAHVHSSLLLTAQGLLTVAALVAYIGGRRAVARGLAVAVLILCALVGYGWWFGARAWSAYQPFSSWSRLRWIGSELLTGVHNRAWVLEGNVSERLTLQMRLVTGEPTWAWAANDSRFRQTRMEGTSGPYASVLEPSGGNPYLSRIYYASRALGGRTFRFSTDLRLASPHAAVEATGISATGSGAIHPVKLSPNWQTVSFRWTVPSSVHDQVLSIVLEHFYGLTFDVRNPHLEELVGGTWRPRAPLVGNGVDVYLARGQTLAEHVYLPTRSWQPITLTHSGTAPVRGRVTAVIRVGPGLTIAVRRARLTDPTGAGPPPTPDLRFVRQRLWFPQPNLLGHTLAVTTLGWLAVTQVGWLALAGWLVACVGTALTGSRAALVVLVLAGFLLLLIMRKVRTVRWRVALGTAGLLLLLGLGFGAQRAGFRVALGLDSTTRPQIWRVAMTAVAQRPVAGVGAWGFQRYYENRARETPATAPTHAHNQWLSYAADYGVPGLVAIIWFTVALSVLAWRRGSRAIVFLTAVYLLQIVDTTLFYSGVFLVTLLVLNTLGDPTSTREPRRNSKQVPLRP